MTIARSRVLTFSAVLFGFAVSTPLQSLAQSNSDLLEQLQRFNKILTLIKHNYVDEVETEELIDGAIEGMLKDLDPHTNYLKPKAHDRMQELNSGEYSGIGISFEIVEGVLTVISPIEGSPSWDLGIKPGDRVIEIEGESAIGITQTEVYDRLRGPEGSKVDVTIERPGEEELRYVTITRSKIAIKSVSQQFMIEPGTGYIRANRFSAHTADELEEALNELADQGMERLVLDLRGNTGGYLTQAIEVTDKLISGGKLVVFTRGRVHGSSEEYFSTDGATHEPFPLIVMINEGSASASEIVSGAVQDWDRGLVVGTTSFGKGLVQRQFPLRGGGSLLLTVAKYYTPSGRLIQRPYDDRDRAQYVSEAGTDGDHADLEEDVEVDAPDQPSHMTAAGRPVFGGGGISPDIVIDPDYSLTDDESALLNTETRLFFDFANEYIGRQHPDFGEFADYAASWHADQAMLEAFREFALNAEPELDPEIFDRNAEFIDDRLRMEFAGNLWGPSQRYQIAMLNDPAVREALTHFESAAMLARGEVEAYLEHMAAHPPEAPAADPVDPDPRDTATIKQ